ncbi:MAG: helix-turn-helix domain-containing protein [Actinomycetota bacterium]|nr:helix-turn-helix domain-containing protein [Actinomycetota bacterium]
MTSIRRPKRFLTAEQKYDLWVRMLTGQTAQAEAAVEVGVDRSTISRLRRVARDAAIAGLQESKAGRKQSSVEKAELAGLNAEVARLQTTIVEQAIELAALRGKASWG